MLKDGDWLEREIILVCCNYTIDLDIFKLQRLRAVVNLALFTRIKKTIKLTTSDHYYYVMSAKCPLYKLLTLPHRKVILRCYKVNEFQMFHSYLE